MSQIAPKDASRTSGNHRVKAYRVTSPNGGSALVNFTAEQASPYPLYPDGIDLALAITLCLYWNIRAMQWGDDTRYSIPHVKLSRVLPPNLKGSPPTPGAASATRPNCN